MTRTAAARRAQGSAARAPARPAPPFPAWPPTGTLSAAAPVPCLRPDSPPAWLRLYAPQRTRPPALATPAPRARPGVGWPSWPPAALVAAVLLCAAAAAPACATDAQGQAAQARHLGRLFTTPQERALLDARRDGSVIESQSAAAPALPPSPPAPMQLNGVVQRSDGRTTVWLNDVPLTARDSKVLPDRSVSLRLPSGKHITLKPGQSYDETTGTIANAGQ